MKSAAGVHVTYKGGSRLGNVGLVALALENTLDKELPISSALSFQASTPAGEMGEADVMKSKCDGMLPPQGKMGCVLKFDFRSPPAKLRVRAAPEHDSAVWFLIELPQKDVGSD